MLSPPLTVDSSESSSGSSKESSSAKLSPQQQQQQQPWCGKPEMLPFLSLCSRYPGSPWAGLLQQTIKEKQQSMAAAAAAASGEIFGPFRIFNFLRSFFRSMYLSCWAKKNRHYKDRSARVSEQRLTQSKYQGYFFFSPNGVRTGTAFLSSAKKYNNDRVKMTLSRLSFFLRRNQFRHPPPNPILLLCLVPHQRHLRIIRLSCLPSSVSTEIGGRRPSLRQPNLQAEPVLPLAGKQQC